MKTARRSRLFAVFPGHSVVVVVVVAIIARRKRWKTGRIIRLIVESTRAIQSAQNTADMSDRRQRQKQTPLRVSTVTAYGRRTPRNKETDNNHQPTPSLYIETAMRTNNERAGSKAAKKR